MQMSRALRNECVEESATRLRKNGETALLYNLSNPHFTYLLHFGKYVDRMRSVEGVDRSDAANVVRPDVLRVCFASPRSPRPASEVCQPTAVK